MIASTSELDAVCAAMDRECDAAAAKLLHHAKAHLVREAAQPVTLVVDAHVWSSYEWRDAPGGEQHLYTRYPLQGLTRRECDVVVWGGAAAGGRAS
jgi:hypothetical protein